MNEGPIIGSSTEERGGGTFSFFARGAGLCRLSDAGVQDQPPQLYKKKLLFHCKNGLLPHCAVYTNAFYVNSLN